MMRLANLAEACGGQLRGNDVALLGVSTDSRADCTDRLFIALKGENFDATDDNAKWLLLTLYVCVPVALKIGVITLLRRFPFELLEIRKPAR